MPEFPESPMSPQEFLEDWLPEAFAQMEPPPGTEGVDVKLGVKLEGEGGGEWIFHLQGGALAVAPGARDEAAFTVVQTVEDWRGALWEGRGGVFGQQAVALFRPGAGEAAGGMSMGAATPSPAALQQMAALDGLMRMLVAGGEGGDWRVDFKLGPGAIPEEPTTTITVTAEDADAMARGELDPMQAFMAGRVQVAGDMALMMQVQAIQMQAALGQPAPGGSGS
jgi:hypothetical protein